jgi:N-acetylglucosamine-6-phosphate deacetylase
LINFTGCNIVSAIRTVSLKPARILGIDKEVGSISKNKKANLVILDKNFNVIYTIINGNTVYSKNNK